MRVCGHPLLHGVPAELGRFCGANAGMYQAVAGISLTWCANWFRWTQPRTVWRQRLRGDHRQSGAAGYREAIGGEYFLRNCHAGLALAAVPKPHPSPETPVPLALTGNPTPAPTRSRW